MMYYSAMDDQTLNRCRSIFSAYSDMVSMESFTKEIDIAATRYTIIHRHSMGNGIDTDACILLGKLCNDFPEESRAYAVSRYVAPLFDLYPSIRLICAQFARVSDLSRQRWTNIHFEHIIRSLYGTQFNKCPYVILVSDFRLLIRTIRQQERESRDGRTKTPLKLDELLESSAEDRKNASSGSTRCYRCSCEKPRRTRCAVCGYVPNR